MDRVLDEGPSEEVDQVFEEYMERVGGGASATARSSIQAQIDSVVEQYKRAQISETRQATSVALSFAECCESNYGLVILELNSSLT